MGGEKTLMGAVTNQEKHWRGFYDLVCADAPPPPAPPSELMRGSLMLFLASRSWRAVRGWRREREEKQEEEEDEEQQGDEERWKRGRRGGEAVGGWGGGSHADLNCSSINTKPPAVRALNRDQTARKNRKGERRVTQDGTAFLHLAGFFFSFSFFFPFCSTRLKLHRSAEKTVEEKSCRIIECIIIQWKMEADQRVCSNKPAAAFSFKTCDIFTALMINAGLCQLCRLNV